MPGPGVPVAAAGLAAAWQSRVAGAAWATKLEPRHWVQVQVTRVRLSSLSDSVLLVLPRLLKWLVTH